MATLFIAIGEAELKEIGRHIVISVEKHERASDNIVNFRTVNVAPWREFCERVGLLPMFFGGKFTDARFTNLGRLPLVAEMGGRATPICIDDYRNLEESIGMLQEKINIGGKSDAIKSRTDMNGLDWLAETCFWALYNCREPIIYTQISGS